MVENAPHTFDWALIEMRSDLEVYRAGWDPRYRWKIYIYKAGGDFSKPFFLLWSSKGLTVPWTANQEDLLANDWQIFTP